MTDQYDTDHTNGNETPDMIATLPTLTFGEGCSEDTLGSLLNNWGVRLTLNDGTAREGIVRWEPPFTHLLLDPFDLQGAPDVLDVGTIVTVEVL